MDGPRQVVFVAPPLWARILGAFIFLILLAAAVLIAIPLAILGFVIFLVAFALSSLSRLVRQPDDVRRNVRVVEPRE